MQAFKILNIICDFLEFLLSCKKQHGMPRKWHKNISIYDLFSVFSCLLDSTPNKGCQVHQSNTIQSLAFSSVLRHFLALFSSPLYQDKIHVRYCKSDGERENIFVEHKNVFKMRIL